MNTRHIRPISAKRGDKEKTIGQARVGGAQWIAEAVLAPLPRLHQIRLILLYGRYLVFTGCFSSEEDALEHAQTFDYRPPLTRMYSKEKTRNE